MIQNKNFGSIHVRATTPSKPQLEQSITEKLIKEDPGLANNPYLLRREVLKRVATKLCIDSSYYLG